VELERKKEQYTELCLQKTAYQRIITRNQGAAPVPEHKRIYMPFIVVKTNKQNNIDCEVTEDYHEIFFNFTSNFEILNDMEILKKMGMHKPGEAQQPVPEATMVAASQGAIDIPESDTTLVPPVAAAPALTQV